MYKLSDNYLYSETDDIINFVSLEVEDSLVFSLNKGAAKTFLQIVNESDISEEELIKSLKLDKDIYQKFKHKLIQTLMDKKIIIQA